MSNFESLYLKQKEYFKVVRKQGLAERKSKLKRVKVWIREHHKEIRDALYADYKKPAAEVDLFEIKPLISEIELAVKELDKWAVPKKVSTPLAYTGTKSRVIKEPKGVVLIIAPWNFPFMLTIGPLISAIAAGNCCVVKPSEMTPHTEQLLVKMLNELFEEEEVAVVTGGVEETTALLNLPFNHIFFTGSPQVGKIVMKAAAEHLSSVTLELGGRNPVVVDESVHLKDLAEKLIWGKFMNAGQSCVSPNYILVPKQKLNEVEEHLIKAYKKFYGDSKIQSNKDFGRIVNEKHYTRVKSLLDEALGSGAEIVMGGECDESDCFISPTILKSISYSNEVFKEEIFGPLLCLYTYENLDDVIELINQQENPLALYVFSKSNSFINKVIESTSAGTTAINETTVQFDHDHLPFGGAGYSGIGKAHGKYGFLEFTNQRSVVKQLSGTSTVKLIYPPYTKLKMKMIKMITWKL